MASFVRAFSDASELLDEFRSSPGVLRTLDEMAQAVATCLRSGNKVLICGNGGSMADAMHFAEEWTGRFRDDRQPYPVLALGDPTHLTCVANDYGFDQVFARGVQAFGKRDDLLIALSTTGNSKNVLLAAESARQIGMKVLGLIGRDGGELAELCDLVVLAPGLTSDRIQELHMLSLHALIEVVEGKLA